MKNLYKLIILSAGLFLASCSKDHSNYDYQPKEKITVTGIESNYTKISELEKLTLSPSITSTDPKAEFEYLWGIYETSVQGYAPVLDTIGRTKDLDYLIKQPAKNWVLVFRVTNKNTGYSEYINSTVNVVTQFTRGWYVAKDDGTNSDLDLFLTPTNIIPSPEGRMENVYSAVNGKKLAGQASLLTFFSSYKSTVTGTLGNTRSLFITTNKDVSGTNINTLKEIRGFNTLFYQTPAVKAPDAVLLGSAANYLVNNGQVHSIYAMSSNTGQFGVGKIRDDKNTPYKVSKYFLSYYLGDPFFFDETSSSFIFGTGSGALLTSISDHPNTTMSANKNNKNLLYMGYKSGTSTPTGFAVFQDKTNPSLKILSQITASKTAFNIANDTLKTTDKIYNGTRFCLLENDENIIYFVNNNNIYSRNLTNKFEQLQFTVPAGEEVTFIRHRKYTVSADATYNYNLVMVGTKIGDSYKVRMFTKSSGNLSSAPVFTLEGKGIVRDVMYMSPSVSEYTYISTY